MFCCSRCPPIWPSISILPLGSGDRVSSPRSGATLGEVVSPIGESGGGLDDCWLSSKGSSYGRDTKLQASEVAKISRT